MADFCDTDRCRRSPRPWGRSSVRASFPPSNGRCPARRSCRANAGGSTGSSAAAASGPEGTRSAKYRVTYKSRGRTFSNINESVMATVNVRNGVKLVHVFDMQNIMCIIQE